MSRAFTKEDAWEEPVIPPRAALPDGVPNYVTPRGLTLLREELAALEAARQSRNAERSDETERRRGLEIANRRLADLAARIASAEVVDPARQAHDQVRFGATVTLRTVQGERAGEERRIAIVGVDEADPDEGRIAFVAPIARAVLGHKVGDIAALRTARGEERLEIVAIAY
jgi:transcription elongation factor GreB